ncbi:MAG TPA: hypothetical protein VHM26_17720, partial [Chitinophagaceae bacterium]|nr:hypothetical protein [Chitinophagaceae bacterium]
MRRKLFFSILVVCATLVASAQPPSQERSDLEKERAAIAKELADIQSAYKDVKNKGKLTLGQLNKINREISLQEKYIGSINKELRIIDDELYKSNLEIYRLQKQVDTLKSEYARTLVYAYKNRSSYDHLNFIFSASSFNDAVKRVEYLKSYRKYRQNQVETILQTQQLITKRQQQQIARKDQKNVALESQTKERQVLDVQKKEKSVVLNEIKSQEKDLQKQIANKKKRDSELKNAVLAIVKREQAKLKEEARLRAEEEKRKNAAAPVVTTKPTTPTTDPGTAKSNTNTEVVTKPNTPTPKKDKEYTIYSEKDIKLGADFNSS